jgi:hypothetical protein
MISLLFLLPGKNDGSAVLLAGETVKGIFRRAGIFSTKIPGLKRG